MKKGHKNYNTTLQISLIRKLKILAAETDVRQNALVEEALRDLFVKYAKNKSNSD